MKEASFSFHNSSLCIGLLSPVTDMRSSGGIDGHKMCLNVFPQKCLEPKPSPRRPDVTCDKQTRFTQRLTRCIVSKFVCYFSRLFTFSCTQVASSQRGLKTEMNSGLAELRHMTVWLSAPMHALSTPQIKVFNEVGRGGGGGGIGGGGGALEEGGHKFYFQNVILF